MCKVAIVRCAGMLIMLTCTLAHAEVSTAGGQQAGADVEAVIAIVEACSERLDPQIDIGYERIAARCPDLARRLEQNALAAWLPEGWKDAGNNLSAGSLQELAVLMRREIATPATGRTPNVKHLHAVLVEIGQSTQQQSSLWRRMRLWLHKVFPSSAEPTDTGWIPRMISRIGLPQTVIELVTYLALAVVIGLSVLILTNEVRQTGLFRRRLGRTESVSRITTVESRVRLDWRDVERAELADKPRVLLELLLDRLTRAHRLPPAHSLTTREISRAASLPDQQNAERLRLIAQTAERLRYASRAPSGAEIEQVVEDGRVLLAELEQAR
jgi:Domain of unknown function (DUF4129)